MEDDENKSKPTIVDYGVATRFKSGQNAVENGRKGGKATQRHKKEKRQFKELLELAFSTEVTSKDGKKASMKEVATIRLATKCANGDLNAIRLAADLLGENIKKSEITGKEGKDLFASLSTEELLKKVDELDRKLE